MGSEEEGGDGGRSAVRFARAVRLGSGPLGWPMCFGMHVVIFLVWWWTNVAGRKAREGGGGEWTAVRGGAGDGGQRRPVGAGGTRASRSWRGGAAVKPSAHNGSLLSRYNLSLADPERAALLYDADEECKASRYLPTPGLFLDLGVLSAPKNAWRRHEVRKLWLDQLRRRVSGRCIRARFIIGHRDYNASDRKLQEQERELLEEMDEYGDIERIMIEDNYKNLPDKVYRIMERGVKGGYAWLVKVDDDQLLYPKQMTEVFGKMTHTDLVYGGRTLWAKPVVDRQRGLNNTFVPYYGGPCYFLSRALARKVVYSKRTPQLFSYGTKSEDLTMGRWVEQEAKKKKLVWNTVKFGDYLPKTGSCAADAKSRNRCGHYGITAFQCETMGCCFDASGRPGGLCYHRTIMCKFVADDLVIGVAYAGNDITRTINGNLSGSSVQRQIFFTQLPGADFIITAKDLSRAGNACKTGGILISCNHLETSPHLWQAYGSHDHIDVNNSHFWGKGPGFAKPCVQPKPVTVTWSQQLPKFWAANNKRYASMRMRLPQPISCTLSLDRELLAVHYNGMDITRALRWDRSAPKETATLTFVKVTSAALVIVAQDVGVGGSCGAGGLSMACKRLDVSKINWLALGSDEEFQQDDPALLGEGLGWGNPCPVPTNVSVERAKEVKDLWAQGGAPFVALRILTP